MVQPEQLNCAGADTTRSRHYDLPELALIRAPRNSARLPTLDQQQTIPWSMPAVHRQGIEPAIPSRATSAGMTPPLDPEVIHRRRQGVGAMLRASGRLDCHHARNPNVSRQDATRCAYELVPQRVLAPRAAPRRYQSAVIWLTT